MLAHSSYERCSCSFLYRVQRRHGLGSLPPMISLKWLDALLKARGHDRRKLPCDVLRNLLRYLMNVFRMTWDLVASLVGTVQAGSTQRLVSLSTGSLQETFNHVCRKDTWWQRPANAGRGH